VIVEPSQPVVDPPPDSHFATLATLDYNLVFFVGAGTNAPDDGSSWTVASPRLPDDSELAEYIATAAKWDSALADLAQVAQHARAHFGEAQVLRWLNLSLRWRDNVQPSATEKRLAGLPNLFRRLKLEPRYPLIVTTKYDAALERAFSSEGEEFDVVAYIAPRAGEKVKFVHYRGGDANPIDQPNEYPDLPIDPLSMHLSRTLIVRLSGSVDDVIGPKKKWPDTCVITEDDYIDFLSGTPINDVVPTQILGKLRNSNYLFLGYTIIPWRLRVFLRRIWEGYRIGGGKHWAVLSQPGQLETDLWGDLGVTVHRSSLTGYLDHLYAYIESHKDEVSRAQR
jgi:SIR2-like domain